MSSSFIAACSTAPVLPHKPILQEYGTTTVRAVERADSFDPLVYCGGDGVFACPQPTAKTAYTAPAHAPAQNPAAFIQDAARMLTESHETQTSLTNVLFDFNQHVLTRAAQQSLVDMMPMLKGRTLELAGFTDSIGGEKYNDRLALARANAVRTFLVTQGLDASVLTMTGEGICCYVAPNNSDESRHRNRRVEIRLKNVLAPEGAQTSAYPSAPNSTYR